MKENLENNDWMEDAPKLATLQRKNPFNVPSGYFEQSATEISNSIFINQLKDKTKSSFTTPNNYFQKFQERIEAKIAIDDLLATKSNSFSVPENYFEDLEARITNKISSSEVKKKTKILRLWQSNLMKYASAACFVILSATGLYFYQNKQVFIPQAQTTNFTNEQMLYDIDESVIIDHVENSIQSQTKKSASDTELENYILNNYSSSELAQELKQ